MSPAAPEELWHPSAELVERARLTEYMRWLAAERGRSFESYEELWRWSVSDLEGFWSSIWDFFDVQADGDPSTALGSHQMPGARWFAETSLNYAEHVFAGKDDGETAILHASELRELAELSWGELRSQVAATAAALRGLGVEPGDRVVAYLPNIPEAIVAFLACASIGAVWSSCSPDFGPASVVDRFAQIEPKVLFAVDGYRYGGRDFDRLGTLADLQESMPSLERTVVLPYLDPRPDLSGLRDAITWEALLAEHEGADLCFERVPFDHPLWVLYSSGTTGLPKAIVQGQGGILLEHLKKLHLHVDAHPGDRLFWFTTTGWMMWNFLVSGLLTRGRDRPLRRQSGPPGHGRPLGPRRAGADHHVRHQRLLHLSLHEGRPAARGGTRPQPARRRRLDRLPALTRGLRLGLRAARRRHLAVLDQRRHGPLHRLRRRRLPAAGLPRRAAGRAPWAPPSRPGTRTATR